MQYIKNIFLLLFVVATVVYSGISVSVAEQAKIIRPDSKIIKLEVGRSLLLQVKSPISAIVTADEGRIIDVQLPSPDSRNIFVLGMAAGRTSLFVMDKQGEVMVQKDFEVIENGVVYLCGTRDSRFKGDGILSDEKERDKDVDKFCSGEQNNTNNWVP